MDELGQRRSQQPWVGGRLTLPKLPVPNGHLGSATAPP